MIGLIVEVIDYDGRERLCEITIIKIHSQLGLAMKNQITPTQREVRFDSSELIVSKTDLSGKITYANKTFMRISDFPEEALLGVQHNLIRHPDMPRGVFLGLWDTLKAGHEFFGVVKNMTANGDHYWVFANVRPDKRQGQIVGYFSVRRPATVNMLTVIEPLYKEMRGIEQTAGPANAPKASWQWMMDKVAAQQTSYERFILDLYRTAHR